MIHPRSMWLRGGLYLVILSLAGVWAGGCLPAPRQADAANPGFLPSPTETTAVLAGGDTSLPVPGSRIEPTPSATPLPTQKPTNTPPPTSTPTPEVSGPLSLQRPIAPPGRQTVDHTYRFGSTQLGAREPHHGVEFVNSFGTPVLAAAPGKVFFAGEDKNGGWGPRNYFWFYGNFVVLEHTTPDGMLYTLYAHLSEISVTTGDQVNAGQELGKVGYTGAATGSHLHFEVRFDPQAYNSSRNPELWLAPLTLDNGEQTGALAGHIILANGTLVNAQDIVIESLATGQPYYLATYADPAIAGLPPFYENFALGDLPPGEYQVSFVAYGLQRQVITIYPNQVTVVEFVVGK